jgi:hypothetical protein
VSDSTDMTALVTRGELREEFAQFEQRLEVRLSQMVTKTDLEVWGGALDDRLGKRIVDAEQRLRDDLAMLAKAHQESIATLISVIDRSTKTYRGA